MLGADEIGQLQAWDKAHYWHGFTQMAEYEPLLFQRGDGCTLIDVHGREYLDGVSSLWCNVHGHRHPKIDAAVRGQLEQVAHTTSLGASHPTTVRLARRLVELSPHGLEHVFFAGDGAAAVEAALKIAFQYWRQCDDPQPEKTKFVALGDAYHGDTLGSVSVGRMPAFHQVFDPLLFPVLKLPAPELYRLPSGVTRENACSHYLEQAETLFAERHGEIAAVVMEPLVQGAAGIVTHPDGYLRGMRALTRHYGILLIADEVAVGMGRTGTLFACEQEDVAPDLLTIGKGLTGGYLPMSAALVNGEVYAAFLGDYAQAKTFFHGHTYGGNPLAAAAALATLEIFDEEQSLENMPPKVARLAEHLGRIVKHPHVGDVRQRGLMAGIELVQDKSSKTPYPWQEKRGYRACAAAREQGVWLRPLGNVVVVVPPLSITLAQLDRVLKAAEYGIGAACDG